jgi:hypothetical protein
MTGLSDTDPVAWQCDHDNAVQRQMFGKPQQEWVPISSLTAPRDAPV